MHRSLLFVGVLGVSVLGLVGPLAPHAVADSASAPAPSAAPAIDVTPIRVEIDHAPAISTDILFEPGDTAIKPAARPLLEAIAKALARDQSSTVWVMCFTDDTAPDNDRTGGSNLRLSQQRAEAITAYLGKHGVTARRLVPKGFGRDKPVAESTNDDARRANRRLELRLVGDVRPPEAGDLAIYTKAIKGKGPLVATIATNQGTLHCQLFDDKAPVAVANFIGLATGQKPWIDPATGKTVKNKPFYDGLTFHRVIPHFMIQGGDPLGRGTGGPGYTFDDELVPGLTHKPGTLAMANAGPSTNGSQFFIDEVDASWLNNKHTIFGQCKELDVVGKITALPRGRDDKPQEPVTITKLTIGRGEQAP
ncbi:MAG TPA: peptidylprolyl isomerase [Kofleriaceae bacterium]|jgi:cyclophilin family peptidyl-prolyl cis-trans isomerase/outer membrane protein OmpA-like peptidoglycan-associated protein|nr:peptidylprolyl isomerase [Kofleriaceae bacterium]